MKTTILFFSLIFAISCNRSDNNSEFQSTEITFTEIGKGELSGNGTENIAQSNLAINNQTDWESLMNQMNSFNNVTNTFTETTIDFENYTIIAIFLEVKLNGWTITINDITENENNLSISVTESELETTVISQPFHIVKIPKTNKEIVLE